MTAKFGPLRFRVPISATDRGNISTPDTAPGNVIEDWPEDALAITGVWPAPLNRALMLRPIFPGAMRFIADNPQAAPSLDEVLTHVQNGRVDDTYLDAVQMTGTLLIRVQQSGHMTEMRRVGTIEALAECPTVALYGPIRLGSKFLREALLDFNRGMLAGATFDGLRVVRPGDADWEARALAGFLGGSYEPMLRAREALTQDDAEQTAMPEVVLNADRSFALGVAIGWMRDAREAPVSVSDSKLEIIPTAVFLRHVGTRVREDVLDAANVDALMSKIFENEDSSKPWTDRLTATLKAMGFGALDGSLQLEQVIREFQISAAGSIAATSRTLVISPQQLALRHFGDLQATANLELYAGPLSGRANEKTRRSVSGWVARGQRCPLLIVAYSAADLDANERPRAGAVPVYADLWSRKETETPTLRMFAADFTRLVAGLPLTEAELELIGYYAPYLGTGGPSTLKPTIGRRVAYAEVTPRRLLEVDEDELIAALPPAAASEQARALASTFKVVRAVSEFECLGFLDKINAYDNAGISYGPCHWAMAGAIDKPNGATELGGLAAYLRYLSESNVVPDVDVFAPQGLAAAASPGRDAAAIARATSGASFINPLCFLDDRGKPRPMDRHGPETMIPSWRCLYRWVAIGRRHEAIGLATWRMALRRLHRLRATPIILKPASGGQSEVSVTIAAAFTSELVMAQLMRWHVKIPGAVVAGSGAKERASDYIVQAYKDAAAAASSASGNAWTAALIEQLRKQLEIFIAKTGTQHDELDEHFDQIADPPWIDDSTDPPTVSDPSFGYALDPRLRILSPQDGTFHLAALHDEP